MFKSAIFSVLSCAVAVPLVVSAGNIGGNAMIQYDEVKVNNGQAYDLLRPAATGGIWKDLRPMCGQTELNMWFPVSEPVRIKAIGASSQYESAKVEMLIWDGKGFVRAGKADKMAFAFNPPRSAGRIRFIMTDISNRDHDVLAYLNWKIEGDSPGQPLYNCDDLKLSCAAKDNVVELPRPLKLEVEIADRVGRVGRFRLCSEMTTFQNSVVKAEKVLETFALPKGGNRKIALEYRHDRQGPYMVSVYLYDDAGGLMLAAKRIIVGLRDPKIFEQSAIDKFPTAYPGKIIPLDQRLRRDGTIWGSDATQSVAGSGRYIGEEFYRKVKSGGGELLMAYMRYSDFEPLPGVYNFEYFDRMIENAGKYGLGLNLGLWWWDFNGPTQFWLADERVRKKDGSSGKGWEGLYSSFSPLFKQHATRAVELIVKRYRDCPQIWLWHPHPYGAVDHDGHGLKDYNPHALKAWAEYLRHKYPNIAAVNSAYGSAYKDWNDVPVPDAPNEKLRKEGKLEESTRVLNYTAPWLDWLDFYHQSLLDMRLDMMRIVRKYDKQRGIGGVNATGGVGKADEIFRRLAEYDAFYGDQGLNINHQVRRLIAKRQYGLKLRHEDIAPVTLGRRDFNRDNIIDRCDWLMFQATFLGVEHFNYVFLAWTDSPFWDRVYANPTARRMVKESSHARLADRKVAYLHSFLTDTLEGNYNYTGISLYRWWLMNGFSYAMMKPGNFFEMLSAEGDLSALKNMKLIVDDNSRVMSAAAVDALTDFVGKGGKLVLLGASGEKTLGHKEDFILLKRLGYGNTEGMSTREIGSATLIFNKDNGVFRKTVSMPVNFWCELKVPQGGRALGFIGEKPGAVVWPYGKGEVVLLAGLPGAIPEAQGLRLYELYQQSGKKKAKNVWAVWNNAERELGRLTGMLTDDLGEWAEVPPLFRINEDFSSCLKIKDREKLVYMYNHGPAQIPVFRMDLPAGKYCLEAEGLDRQHSRETVGAEQLAAPGVKLPELKSQRYLMLRITPVSDQDPIKKP